MQVVAIYQELGRKQEALILCENTLDFAAKKHWDELPPVGLVYVALAGLQADAGDYQAAQENLDTGRGLVERDITPEIISMMNEVEEKLGNIVPPFEPLVDSLSERELEVLRLIAQGLSNREISEQLFLALSTVKGHNQNIFGKLQVQRRTEAVARARELGLL
jgi:DNA-binding NarL/FixJ family response regulator